MKIDSAKIKLFEIPLNRPYNLSFTTIHHIISNVIEITTDTGRSAIGEAVALKGYSDETQYELFCRLKEAEEAINANNGYIEEVVDFSSKLIMRGSFAASAVQTALDLIGGQFQPPSVVRIPVTGTVSSDFDSLIQETGRLIDLGYRTIKVKIGRNPQRDMAKASELISQFSGCACFRFDANQAYDLKQAEKFLTSLNRRDNQCVELIEQPLPIDQWENMAELVRLSPVPLMLDESIYTIEDIKRAADINVPFVKLKLFKHSGIIELLEVAEYAHSLGIRVIIGNGVATDIGNLAESWAYSFSQHLFHGACEANGFIKLEFPCLRYPPTIENGFICWNRPEDLSTLYEYN